MLTSAKRVVSVGRVDTLNGDEEPERLIRTPFGSWISICSAPRRLAPFAVDTIFRCWIITPRIHNLHPSLSLSPRSLSSCRCLISHTRLSSSSFSHGTRSIVPFSSRILASVRARSCAALRANAASCSARNWRALKRGALREVGGVVVRDEGEHAEKERGVQVGEEGGGGGWCGF